MLPKNKKNSTQQSYQLKTSNDTLIGLAVILLLFPVLCGVFVLSAVIGKHIVNSFLLVLFEILSVYVFYLIIRSSIRAWKKYAPIAIANLSDNHLIVTNERNKQCKQYPFSELAFLDVQYLNDKGTMIHIISNEGKCMLSCFYDEQFLNSLIKQIHAFPKRIYSEKTRNGVRCRWFYIHPLYLDAAIVKRKAKRAAYY